MPKITGIPLNEDSQRPGTEAVSFGDFVIVAVPSEAFSKLAQKAAKSSTTTSSLLAKIIEDFLQE